jgi:hypothetical protein
MPRLALDAIVAHQGVGVDTSALTVQRVGLRPEQGAGKDVCADHA